MVKLKAYWKRITGRLNLQYKIGMRVVKTIVAVTICMLISLVSHDTNLISVSAVSAIVTLRASNRDTLRAGLLRLVGTLIGGLIGLLCVVIESFVPFYNQGLYVIIIPLMMLLDFYICNVFNLTDAAAISSIVVLLVATHVNMAAGEAISYAIQRVVDTLIGVAVATAVNMLIYPRKEKDMGSLADDGVEEECEKKNIGD
ncbi:aromatic acid exporter family protein [Christensenellaceae bacterium OttesenSCG-928-M15]|nr:aromatic acid exporter family protein [Christensenellaceae bacterium OttesenSCG-928-M15]